MAGYSPVYSSPFIFYDGSGTPPGFEVPAGQTAIVRDFTAYASAAATFAQLWIQGAPTAPEIVVAQLQLEAVAAFASWSGRIVLPSGYLLGMTVGSESAGVNAYAGGYLLQNVLP